MYETPNVTVELDGEVVNAVKRSLRNLSIDIETRNNYIEKRRRFIYEQGLFENLDFSRGRDKTLYNFLDRTCEIHTSQFMGRGFSVYSTYNKEDLSIYKDGDPELERAEVSNKQKKAFAETRKKAWDAIVEDNGGMDLFMRGARLGAEGGNTVYKAYWDADENKYEIKLIEDVRNYWAGWSSSDFREADFHSYMYQISESHAYREYGDKLKEGESFEVSTLGNPLVASTQEVDSLGTSTAIKSTQDSQQKPMVTVIDFTGYLDGYSFENGKPVKVKRGQEKPVNLHIVGGHLCQVITEERYLPKYYFIPNKHKTNYPWGLSDISDSAIDINQTFIYAMSTGVTLFHKEIAPTYLAKGFGSGNLPKRQSSMTTMIPMQLDQTLELLEAPATYVQVTRQLLDELKENYVREVGIGRVLFDDPSINPTSNQALMTTLKPVVDKAEAKQKIWSPILVQMAKDAVATSSKFVKELKDAAAEPGWDFYVEWPSVLRKEDQAYQQMWLNLFNAGVVSIDTYLEKVGVDDTSEEIDRSRDDMKDPVKAAIRGKLLGELAQQVVSPQTGQPPAPQVKYNVNVKADASVDPTTNVGVIDEVMGGDPGAFPQAQPTPDQANPVLTPDQNTGQTASQPGSGATAVSPEGANAMIAQQNGA